MEEEGFLEAPFLDFGLSGNREIEDFEETDDRKVRLKSHILNIFFEWFRNWDSCIGYFFEEFMYTPLMQPLFPFQ